MFNKKFYLLVFFVFFLFGCVNQSDLRIPYTPTTYNFTYGDGIHESNYMCSCFICSHTESHSELLATVSKFNLLGERCFIVKNCSLDLYNETTVNFFSKNTTDSGFNYTFPFGYGYGPTFSDFDLATIFSGNSLIYASQWYYNDPLYDYPRYPDLDRLDYYNFEGIIPVLVILKDYDFANYTYYINLANNLSQGGPVIVSPYSYFNIEDEDELDNFIAYAGIIRYLCDNCLIAISPDISLDLRDTPYKNKTNMSIFYEKMNDPFSNLNESVDLVGLFAIANTHNIVNPSRIFDKAMTKSRFILNETQKPSIILAASVSKSISMTFNGDVQDLSSFNEVDVASFYFQATKKAEALASSGILGVIFYSMYDKGIEEYLPITCPVNMMEDPDTPINCTYSLIPNFSNLSKNISEYFEEYEIYPAVSFQTNMYKNRYLARDHVYMLFEEHNITSLIPSFHDNYAYNIPMVYSSFGDPCVECIDYAPGRIFSFREPFVDSKNYSVLNNTLSDFILGYPIDGVSQRYPVCYGAERLNFLEDDWWNFITDGIPYFTNPNLYNGDKLTPWSELGRVFWIWGGRLEVDSNALKAIAKVETNLNRNRIGYVDISNVNFGLRENQLDVNANSDFITEVHRYFPYPEYRFETYTILRNQLNENVFDPNMGSGEICYKNNESICSRYGDLSPCKPAKFGIMGLADFPGAIYQKYNEEGNLPNMPIHIEKCGGENYDPLNDHHSVCAGAYLLKDYYEKATNFVNDRLDLVDRAYHFDDPNHDYYQEGMKRWFTFFVTVESYGRKGLNFNILENPNLLNENISRWINEYRRVINGTSALIGEFCHKNNEGEYTRQEINESHYYCCDQTNPNLSFFNYLFSCTTPNEFNDSYANSYPVYSKKFFDYYHLFNNFSPQKCPLTYLSFD